jgi:hypothetical protein
MALVTCATARRRRGDSSAGQTPYFAINSVSLLTSASAHAQQTAAVQQNRSSLQGVFSSKKRFADGRIMRERGIQLVQR